MNPLADLLPAQARKIVYAVFALAIPVATVLVATLKDGWQNDDLILILTSAATAGGFGMAASNTPATFKRVETTSTVVEQPRDAGQSFVAIVYAVVLVLAAIALFIWIERQL